MDTLPQNIAFSATGAVIVAATIRMLTVRNVVHAAVALVIVLAGLAANYILLTAEFVAVTQVLIYIGAVMVLFLFGIMLTRAPIGSIVQMTSRQWPVALITSLLLAGVLGYALVDAFADDELPTNATVRTTADVGDSIFSQYLVPFEAVSVLLLAALIGAVVLARRD